MFLNWKNIQYNWTEKKIKHFKAHANFNLDFSIKVQFKNSHHYKLPKLGQTLLKSVSL